MSKPIIGITTGHSENRYGLHQIHILTSYVNAIIKAGGVPLIIPPELAKNGWEILYEKLDGILFSGGADINPKVFNGEDHPSIEGVDDQRDAIEISLTLRAIEDKKPFLAICRGFQILNVALGGTLYTHLSEQFGDSLQHATPRDKSRNSLVHEVKIEKDSHLAKILEKTTVNVNSWHHQGAKDIPSQLKITAHTSDGLVEAMELPNHPFGIAVQWHPEWIPEDEAMQKLFRAFIEASGK